MSNKYYSDQDTTKKAGHHVPVYLDRTNSVNGGGCAVGTTDCPRCFGTGCVCPINKNKNTCFNDCCPACRGAGVLPTTGITTTTNKRSHRKAKTETTNPYSLGSQKDLLKHK